MTNQPTDLWTRVDIGEADDCWPWLGGCKPNGYGTLSIAGKGYSTHRIAYEVAVGLIPDGLFVCHRCDNPPCCNPAHLFLGTPSDNTRDMHAKGRLPSRKGERHPLSKLSNAQREEIVARRKYGERGIDLAREFNVSQPTITRLVKEGVPA